MAGGNYPRVDYTCAMVPTASTFTLPSFSIYSNVKNECIIDEVPSVHNNTVRHRSMHQVFEPYDGTGAYIESASGGHYVLTGAAAKLQLTQKNRMLAATGFDWNFPSYPQPYPVPLGWSIDTSLLNESALIEDCFERADGLVADMLLNVIQANQMWPSIKGLCEALPKVAANWRSWKKFTGKVASDVLAWKFGIAPIISDIEATMRYLPKLADDIKRIKDGDSYRYSKVAVLPAVFNIAPLTVNYSSVSTYSGTIQSQPVVRYVLVVKPTSSDYHSDFFKSADRMLSRFATSPANLAWELVPFSFVIDWFVDLRGALRALDGLCGIEPYKVLAFSRSYSYKLTTKTKFTINSGCAPPVKLAELDCGSTKYSHYDRSPVSMSATWPTWKPRFGKNQAGISAALIGQQLSKLGH